MFQKLKLKHKFCPKNVECVSFVTKQENLIYFALFLVQYRLPRLMQCALCKFRCFATRLVGATFGLHSSFSVHRASVLPPTFSSLESQTFHSVAISIQNILNTFLFFHKPYLIWIFDFKLRAKTIESFRELLLCSCFGCHVQHRNLKTIN